MTRTLDALWEKLVQHRIVEGNRPGLSTDDNPWYLRLLSAFSGWIAALFLIAFLFSLFSSLLKSVTANVLIGIALLFLAHLALKRQNAEFLSHAALAISLAGQALVIYALAKVFEPQFALLALSVAALEALLFIVMRSYIHRVFCAFCTCAAIYFAANYGASTTMTIGAYGVQHALIVAGLALLAAWLWLNEFQQTNYRELFHPLSWGVSLALVTFGSFAIFVPDQRFAGSTNEHVPALHWLSEALVGIVLVWVVSQILKRREHLTQAVKLMWLFTAAIFSLVSLAAPGIALGLIIVVVGYHQQNRLLLGIGFIALGAYLSRYYYSLDQSLAYKSAVLLACGIFCFLIRGLLRRVGSRHLPGNGVTR